ncbi:hydrogenase maturation protein [Inmirania thermothiophila]|uniref:Putative two-component system hydrogenase maturation factor HypX/HoxX n=1 Tax=Inmirania thermothiophila TaxID=1750597 RepID=A0A3N1Y112_9GAMM|nr:hydrogenase maturation protein [Inmirania thermothiophila]ROR32523.1 putative two-component system hydrogenase maturation factor HypX/HoxX [Inmirania thermothiophila]
MRILLLCHGFNSLSQRLYVELAARGHDLSVELDIHDSVTEEAVALFRPELVLAPFLKRAIPASVWRRVPCLVVHPGPPGDRGPAALDWAILDGVPEWGVTVLQAEAEMDAGPVWAWRTFPMRAARKSSLYRFEVTEGAVAAVLEAVARLEAGQGPPPPPASHPAARGWRGVVPRAVRAVRWGEDDAATVLAKVRSGDGFPGAVAELAGRTVRLFDAHPAPGTAGPPGALLARREGAVCVGTGEGAVWIGRLRAEGEPEAVKLPATAVLGDAAAALPEREGDPFTAQGDGAGEIRYEEAGGVGYLRFDFYNGAMRTAQCRRLEAAVRGAAQRPVRVLVLTGGRDFWSNGMDLNSIEAAESPADESMRNIEAMDDLVLALIRCTDRIVVSALRGNAGAGGCFLALAADEVWLRRGVVLNPHYRNMGNLYGSEYWTYLLPRRVGPDGVARVLDRRLPMGAAEAHALGLADAVGPAAPEAFDRWVRERAQALAADPGLARRIAEKARRRAADEAERPLAAYREAELARIRLNFYGFDPSYHVARYDFVHRRPHSWTPLHLAMHRRGGVTRTVGS